MTDPVMPLRRNAAEPSNLLLSVRHLELIRTARLALDRYTDRTNSRADMNAMKPVWQAAAVRLALALVSHLESIEEARHD